MVKSKLVKGLSLVGLLLMMMVWGIFSIQSVTQASNNQQALVASATETQPTPLITTTPVTVGDDFQVYTVQFVDKDDTLNVRSGAGVEHPIVGELVNGDEVQALGVTKPVGDNLWLPVQSLYNTELSGWINRFYVVLKTDPAVYCADANAQALIDEVREAVRTQDGERLAKTVTPLRGLYVGGLYWEKIVHLSSDEVRDFFTDSTVRDWGMQEYGSHIQGSIPDVVVPLLTENLLPQDVSRACFDSQDGLMGPGVYGFKYGIDKLPFYSVMRPGTYAHELDWGAWAFGIDYWEGTPSLSYLSYYFWTP
jgi:hypothetical protein